MKKAQISVRLHSSSRMGWLTGTWTSKVPTMMAENLQKELQGPVVHIILGPGSLLRPAVAWDPCATTNPMDQGTRIEWQ